jgi:hypothetical protein
MSLPASVICFILLIYTASVHESYIESRPNAVFRSAFGFDPPPDVKILNASHTRFTKWHDADLEFYADDSTVQRILGKGYFPKESMPGMHTTISPGWWAFSDSSRKGLYYGIHGQQPYPSDYLSYDSAAHLVRLSYHRWY